MPDVSLTHDEAEGDLPPACMCCGDPATVWIECAFLAHAAVSVFWEVFVVRLALALGQPVIRVRTSFCPRHRHYWRLRSALFFGGIAGFVAVVVGSVIVVILLIGVAKIDSPLVNALGIAPIFVCMIAWAAAAVLVSQRTLRARRIRHDGVVLQKVAQAYVAAVQARRPPSAAAPPLPIAPPTNAAMLPGPLQPHRGGLLIVFGILNLFLGSLILGPITWFLAHDDLRKMDAGRMDAAGRKQTRIARILALVGTLLWPLLLSCCCGVTLVDQLIEGGSLISAAGSRRITRAEFNRVQGGMTKQQVTDILGRPARTDHHGGVPTWYWYEKHGRATFDVGFNEQGRVNHTGMDDPD